MVDCDAFDRSQERQLREPVDAEAGIERAVDVVSNDRPDPIGRACHHGLAVQLERDVIGEKAAIPAGDAVVAESGVERRRRQQPTPLQWLDESGMRATGIGRVSVISHEGLHLEIARLRAQVTRNVRIVLASRPGVAQARINSNARRLEEWPMVAESAVTKDVPYRWASSRRSSKLTFPSEE